MLRQDCLGTFRHSNMKTTHHILISFGFYGQFSLFWFVASSFVILTHTPTHPPTPFVFNHHDRVFSQRLPHTYSSWVLFSVSNYSCKINQQSLVDVETFCNIFFHFFTNLYNIFLYFNISDMHDLKLLLNFPIFILYYAHLLILYHFFGFVSIFDSVEFISNIFEQQFSFLSFYFLRKLPLSYIPTLILIYLIYTHTLCTVISIGLCELHFFNSKFKIESIGHEIYRLNDLGHFFSSWALWFIPSGSERNINWEVGMLKNPLKKPTNTSLLRCRF